MFDRLARAIARRPRTTALAWLAALVAAVLLAIVGIGGSGLFDRLESGALRVPGSESQAARDILEENESTGPTVTLVVQGVDVTDEAEVAAIALAIAPMRADLAAIPGVAMVVDPFLFPGGPADPDAASLVSTTRDGFLLAVDLAPGLSQDEEAETSAAVVERLRIVPGELADAAPGATGIVTSSALITRAVIDQVEADLKTGELIALPVSLLVMVVVFGGFLAAGLPLAGAIASIVGGLAVLLAFTYVMDVDSVVVNVVTVVGLGLSIDYGLLIVSRYREELRAAVDDLDHPRARRRHRDPVVERALGRTLTTAGRTVMFSAVTVAISIAGLLVMRAEILRSLGAAGVSVVVLAVVSALTLVPALLVLLGRRMLRPPLLARVPGVRVLVRRLGDVAPEDGLFSGLARGVQAHPWWVMLGSLVVLAVLAAPALGLQMRNSTTELLPPTSDQRTVLEIIGSGYPASASPAVVVVAEATLAEVGEWAPEVGALPDVLSVDPPAQVGSYVVLGVRPDTTDAGGPVASDVVRAVRDLDPGFEIWVMGQAASQIDFVDSLLDGLPWAVTIVVVTTFVLLFLMTGSVLVPVKALLVNALSLTASLGITVWVFQEGHLEGFLDFVSPGGIESYIVAVALAFGFGLAMDYEVFLLSRIKELYDGGMSNDDAVVYGLQRSGRIITSAALVMIVVFAGFVAGQLLVIKEIGVALAVTVLVDATLVRMLLVPATMTLLGTWNWWAPAPLRRVYERFAIRH